MFGGAPKKNQGESAGEEQQPLNSNANNLNPEQPVPGVQPVEATEPVAPRKTTAAQSSIMRSLQWLTFSISFTIFVDVIYGWLLCGLTQACLFSGIESPAWLSRSVLLFMAITFIILVLSYNFVSELNKEWIRVLKFVLFFWGIILIIFAILSFILISGGSALDQRKQISELTEIVKTYYSTLCETGTAQECIDSKYERNALIIAIFHLANGILVFIIFAMLINLDIPDIFRPKSTSRRFGSEKGFIVFDKRYIQQSGNRRKQEKDIEENKNNQGNQEIGDTNQIQRQDDQRIRNIDDAPNPDPFSNHRKPY